MKTIFRAFLVCLPWFLRRRALAMFCGYEIHPSARIGLAWVFPRHLVMGPKSEIGHLTVCINLAEVRLDEGALIGRMNWITGFPSGHPRHFTHQPERKPRLHVEREAAITHRHIIDCTAEVLIGEFSTMAGFRSQILTHSIDIQAGRQSSQPVRVGARSFVGSGCIILGGAALPACSVLGAGSLLNKAFETPFMLYAGTPAQPRKVLAENALYFTRRAGYVD